MQESDARDCDVLTVCTIVNCPITMGAFADVLFCSIAVDVVQPNHSVAHAVLANVHLSSDISETKRIANNSCCRVSESIITNGSPLSAMKHF